MVHFPNHGVKQDQGSLNKCVAFAASSHGVPVKVYKFKFTERLEHLLNIRFGEIEGERANVKSATVLE